MTEQLDYDICIVGGGMVGASAALQLSHLAPSLRLAVVESHPFQAASPHDYQPSYDGRATALSYSSRKIFEGLGLWPRLASQVAPIVTIHVSDRGHSGNTVLSAAQHRLEALGYVVENRCLGQHLSEALARQQGVTLLAPCRAEQLRFHGDCAALSLDNGTRLRCRLVIIADGAESPLRNALGIGLEESSYRQHALIAGVEVDRPHRQVAYERFTDTGPMALLPLAGQHHFALVWTVPDHLLAPLLGSSSEQQLSLLQQRFGRRAGNFQALRNVASYPLSLKRSREQVRSRVVVLGNAAHTLHPVAGQGFNLSLRDSEALAKVLAKLPLAELGTLPALQRYQAQRHNDQQRVITASDQLVRWFSSPRLVKAAARNLGLLGLDALPAARDAFARLAMGLE